VSCDFYATNVINSLTIGFPRP